MSFFRSNRVPGFIFAAAVALLGIAPLARGAAEADIVIGYAATWGNSVGGADNVEVIAANTVAGANAIYERSGAPPRMRVVGCYQSLQDNTNRTSTGGIVGWLNGYDSRISDVVDVGNAIGADLVTYVCTNNDSATIGAVAGQPGRFSCFNPGAFWSTVFCHEAGGHNFGCDHRGGDDNPKTVMMHNYCGGGANAYFSNPNIWLNGARLLGTGTCLGAAVDQGDNAYLLSNNAQGVADRNARLISAPALSNVVRRWSFNQAASAAPAGTTVTDSITGTALATVQGAGATFTGDGLRIPGGTGASGAAYLQLPAATVSAYTNVTVEIWAKTLSVQNWARVMDFNNGTGNYLLLAASRGTALSSQRFESKAAATVTLDSDVATAANVMYHYAITFADNGTGGGRWTWFRDGDVIAFLDVAYTLAAFQDVNNWLGRSAFAGDNLANAEYAEVRISNIAMSRTQVAANARLGPNRVAKNATLTADDPVGQNSFDVAGRWSDGLAPSGAKSYETFGFRLRTPADGTSRTFAGQSLVMNGGSLTWKGTANSTSTINNFTLGGTDAEILNAGSGTWTLAGTMNVQSPEVTVRAANGPINLSASLSGSGALMHLNNTVTLSGNNTAFTGRTVVGDGRFSSLSIDSEARLGGNPSTFTPDQFTLNRGVLYTGSNITIDDANRGIRVGESAAIFNVAPGTTLTVAVPVAGTGSGDTLLTAPIYPNPASGMLIKENTGMLVFTSPNNSHVGEIVINGGQIRLDGAGRFNNGDTPMPVVINGTLNLNTTGNQIFGGEISGGGTFIKGSSGTTTLTAANTFSGSVTLNGGTVYANAGNAATNRNFSYVSGITVNTGATLRTNSNALFGWDGTQEKPITVNAGGILTANGGLASDVGLGTVTLNGGTLATLAVGATDYGSFRFDEAADKLAVTADSTVSATNVKFGNAAASIDVSAGKTCNFTGTITNASNGGISYLTKNDGTGTLILSGTNTFTGATAINAGTLKLTGSLAAGSAVTVANGATVSGTGTINGSLTFAAGSIHAPGDATGTQTVGGALSYAGTSRVKSTLSTNSNTTGAASRIVAGNVTVTAGAAIDFILNAAGSTVNFTDTFWSQSRTWNVMTCSNKTGNFTLGTVTGDAGGRVLSNYGTLALQQSTTSASLVFTPYTPTELWRQAYFGINWDTTGISGDGVDGDGDGLSNLLEYGLGSNPNTSSAGSAPLVSTDAGKLKITFGRNTAASDVTLAVVASDSLQTTWTDIARSIGGAAFTTTPAGAAASVNESGAGGVKSVQATDIYLTSDPAHPTRFMRVEVRR
ncbi:MAG: autotransporter-associated beta strand repeat-containing protein [Luteolibacter sp.]|uniref:beta strand repeat-containing protein n=1 Tax=Luteolibacter sp. TaxID=1962973 RepID=UPI0032632FBC